MITIQIDTDNAAFHGQDGPEPFEAARILRALADSIEAGAELCPKGSATPIMDYNGQRTGRIWAS